MTTKANGKATPAPEGFTSSEERMSKRGMSWNIYLKNIESHRKVRDHFERRKLLEGRSVASMVLELLVDHVQCVEKVSKK